MDEQSEAPFVVHFEPIEWHKEQMCQNLIQINSFQSEYPGPGQT